MRGNAAVIEQLNKALKEELTAINQYFLHAEMCHSWGYHKIGAFIKKQSIDEMRHAEKIIERLLFLLGRVLCRHERLRRVGRERFARDLQIGLVGRDEPTQLGLRTRHEQQVRRRMHELLGA